MEIKNKILLSAVISFLVLTLLFVVSGEGNQSNEVSYVEVDDIMLVEDTTNILEENTAIENLSVETNSIVFDELEERSEKTLFEENTLELEEDVTIRTLDGEECNVESENYPGCLEIESNNESIDKSLDVFVINLPDPNVSRSDKYFNFGVNESNLSDYYCNFSIYNQTLAVHSAIILNPINVELNKTFSNSTYNWNIFCFEEENQSLNDSINGSFIVNVDLNPKINFWLNKNNFSVNEQVSIKVNATLLSPSPISINIIYSDGRYSSDLPSSSMTYYEKELTTSFSSAGNYNLGLTFTVLNTGIQYYRNLSLSVYTNASNPNNNNNNSSSGKDIQKPEIDLVSPSDEAELDSSSVDFVFTPKDNIKLSNCTYNLYYYNGSNYIGTLVYKQFYSNPDNDEDITLTLREFDEGDYSWDVECVDNSSNVRVAERDFSFVDETTGSVRTVNLNDNEGDYESDLEEVEALIAMINEFLVEEEKYDLENKEAVEFLGLLDEARYYKKRLLQLKSDLDDNLGYSRDASGKQDRLDEIRIEIKEIKKKVIYKVNVDKSETFSKNSLTSDIEEVISIYLNGTDVFMTSRELSRLSDKLANLQRDLTVESHIKWVTFEYLDQSTKQYSLVYKKLKGSDKFEGIIEVIPKSVIDDVAEIQFLQENEVILEDPIVFFDSDSFDDKIVYLIKSKVDFDELRKIDSIGYSASEIDSTSRNSITGYSILFFPEDKGFWFYFSWILLLIVLGIVIYNSIRVSRVRVLKRQENYQKIKAALKNAKNAIDDKDVPRAKEIYLELKSLYSASSDEVKSYFYNDLIKVQLLIDRKEISSLIRECVTAINQKRMSDASLIYAKIKPIYKRLPEDLRTRVYERIIPFVK